MGSMARKLIAQYRVFRIVRTASDDVAGVKVAHHERDVSRLKPVFDLLAQEQPDVTQLDVSGCVALRSSVSQQLLSRAFGHRDDRMPAVHDPPFQRSEKSAFALQLEGYFGDQCEVHILARD